MEESAPIVPIKVTVLILSENSAPALRECLPALEASQAREQIEIIVVDCGSTDGSATLDTEFPAITIQRLPRNFGATRALNIGMRTSAGDYLFLLAPEVIVEPGTVMALAQRLDTDESAAAVCPLLVDSSGRAQTQVSRLPGANDMNALWRDPESLPRTAIDPAAESVAIGYPGRTAFFVRKFFVKGINWLDARYGEFGGDLELAFQIQRSQKKILLLPGVPVTLRPHPAREYGTAALATLSADRAHGIAVFMAKHSGFISGLIFRITAVLMTLVRLLTFQQPAFQLRLLIALVSGQKIDGSQAAL